MITPDMLHEIDPEGATAGPNAVSPGRRPAWSRARPFRPPGPKGRRHLCFTAVIDDARDGAQQLELPSHSWPYFDWRQFRWFSRQANVGCRNVHLVDRPGPRAKRPLELPFLVTGTPDRARRFDFEIVRNLDAAVELDLLAQAALAWRLRRTRLWAATPPPAGSQDVVLHLPRQPRLRVERVRLVAGASFPCRLRVGRGVEEGDSLVVRQLYRGREVGRITWIFRRRRRKLPRSGLRGG